MKFKRIKDLREDNDKLQKEIAELLGISQQYYNTSIDYIVGLSNEKNKK